MLPQILKTKDSLIKKTQAFVHLNQYMVHPMMTILALLSYPLIFLLKPPVNHTTISLATGILWCLTLLGTFAPSFLYIVSQKIGYKNWRQRSLFIPALMFIGCGLAINNTKAVLEALLNMKSDFIRTPKYGVVTRGKSMTVKNYTSPMTLIFISEILLSIYCFIGFMQYTNNSKFVFGPFLLMYAIGFFYVGILSLLQNFKEKIKC